MSTKKRPGSSAPTQTGIKKPPTTKQNSVPPKKPKKQSPEDRIKELERENEALRKEIETLTEMRGNGNMFGEGIDVSKNAAQNKKSSKSAASLSGSDVQSSEKTKLENQPKVTDDLKRLQMTQFCVFFKCENQQLRQEVLRMKEELSRSFQDRQMWGVEFKRLFHDEDYSASKVKRLKLDYEKFRHRANKLLEEKQNELKQLKEKTLQKQQLEERNERLEAEIKNLRQENDTSNMSELIAQPELRKLEERITSLEKENSYLKLKNKKEYSTNLQSELKEMKDKLDKKDEEWSNKMKQNLQTHISPAAESDEMLNLRKQVDTKKTEIEQLTERNKILESKIEEFKQKAESEKLPQSARKLKRDLKDAEERVKHLEKEREELLKEKKNNIEEIDNLKNRLSQLAGAKLTDSNPAIADLSDPNRPLNLGEKFSELYDNQWTDALEEVENVFKNEEKAITYLLETVMNAYKFCLEKADDYLNSLKRGACKVTGEHDPTSLELKLMKDHRKSMAVHLSLGLQEEFCKKNKVEHKQKENTVAYQKRCVQVCWFMTVQDPAVYIDSKENVKGKPFDTDKYKHYTKTGKIADYLVWPVLYLHKDGPMLGKGVAQGQK